MDLDEFAKQQRSIIDAGIARILSRVDEQYHAAARSHEWFLDISDMEFECVRCHAVLGHGERFKQTCHGRKAT